MGGRVNSAQGTAPDLLEMPIAGAPPPPRERKRLVGLDGIRGIAALAVVFHHCYLLAFPGYPAITGPWWAGWLIYGHFSVVVFIVLSGFSLAVSPVRAGWRLDKTKFAKRRAWRILPPYWAALVFSLMIAWAVIPQPGEAAPTGKSVVAYGLLLQDIVGSPSPNGAFWSIAVEAQLYIVFPLMLLLIRRGSAAVMLSLVGTAVALIGILSPTMPTVDKLMRLTPQFAVLFGLGVVAAGVLSADWTSRVPWQWLALVTAVPVFAAIGIAGSVWTIDHFFWIDMLVGIPFALLLAAMATEHPRWLLRALDIRPIRSLGSFSYSLYLVHAPIVVAVYTKFVEPRYPPGAPAFLATVLIAGTISVIGARVFAAVFEIPFQRYRSWTALRAATQPRISRLRAFMAEPRSMIGSSRLGGTESPAPVAPPASVPPALVPPTSVPLASVPLASVPLAAPVAREAPAPAATALSTGGTPGSQAGALGHVGRATVPPRPDRGTAKVSTESDP
jgi:peptidoglycan/LPS O-acetylase OafA/YrhL